MIKDPSAMNAAELAAFILRLTGGALPGTVRNMDARASGEFLARATAARKYALRAKPQLAQLQKHFKNIEGDYRGTY